MSNYTSTSTNNVAQMRIKDIPAWLSVLHELGISGMIHGVPGCGKTQTIKEYARQRGIPFHIVLLSMCDPVDLKGIPMPVKLTRLTTNPDGTEEEVTRTVTEFFPPNMLPDGPGVLCFDEINQGLPAVMSAAQSILLERRSGTWAAHPELLIVGTGNRLGDKTGVNVLPSAMDNRLCHCEVSPNRDDFVRFLTNKYIGRIKEVSTNSGDTVVTTDIDISKMSPEDAARVEQTMTLIQYFEWQHDAHHKFDPGLVRLGIHGQPTWRTWEMQLRARIKHAQMAKANPNVTIDLIDRITEGLVGVSHGVAYSNFCKTVRELEKSHPKLFMADNNSAWEWPKDPGVLYALVSVLPLHMTALKGTGKAAAHAAKRFKEFTELCKRNNRSEMNPVFFRACAITLGHECMLNHHDTIAGMREYAQYVTLG